MLTKKQLLDFYLPYLTPQEQKQQWVLDRAKKLVEKDKPISSKNVVFDWSGTGRSLKAILALRK